MACLCACRLLTRMQAGMLLGLCQRPNMPAPPPPASCSCCPQIAKPGTHAAAAAAKRLLEAAVLDARNAWFVLVDDATGGCDEAPGCEGFKKKRPCLPHMPPFLPPPAAPSRSAAVPPHPLLQPADERGAQPHRRLPPQGGRGAGCGQRAANVWCLLACHTARTALSADSLSTPHAHSPLDRTDSWRASARRPPCRRRCLTPPATGASQRSGGCSTARALVGGARGGVGYAGRPRAQAADLLAGWRSSGRRRRHMPLPTLHPDAPSSPLMQAC